MSCDVSSSPFLDHSANTEPSFDGKASFNDAIDLSAISNFNASFQSLDQDSIDPCSHFNSPSYGLDQTLSPDPSSLYPDFGSAPSSPYFQSIEPAAPPFIPSPLRNQYSHRRSVSEPPNDAMLQHHHAQPNQQVTFHRDGHKLGAPQPKSSYAPAAKKLKASRNQSYRNGNAANPATSQNHYQLRRANTQPNHRGPTSTPMGVMMCPPPPHFPPHFSPQQTMHIPFEPMHEESPYVTSRVCTPAPEAVDPMLTGQQAPMVPHMRGTMAFPGSIQPGNIMPAPKALVIKMGVEELRMLIHDAVQKAVQELESRKKSPKESRGATVDAGLGGDIVVAGMSSAEEEVDAEMAPDPVMEEL